MEGAGATAAATSPVGREEKFELEPDWKTLRHRRLEPAEADPYLTELPSLFINEERGAQSTCEGGIGQEESATNRNLGEVKIP